VFNCKKCHYPIADPDLFCPTCGTRLDDDGPVASPDASQPSSATIKHVMLTPLKVTPGRIRIAGWGEMAPPEGVTPPFKFDATFGGTGAQGQLIDSKGRGWYLMRNRPDSNLYHWRRIVRTRRKRGGFNMAMRLVRDEPTLFQIAADWNQRQWAINASGYRSLSLDQAEMGTGRNTTARKSQGSVMAKFFLAVANGTASGLTPPLSTVTREHAIETLNLCTSGSLSASEYTGRHDQEWLHLRGHGLGGKEEAGNLVAGSHGANSEMAAIEMVLQQFDGKRPLTFSVKADCFDGTLLSIVIIMKVELSGTCIYHHTIAANRERLSQLEYTQIQDELVNRIVTDGRKGREIRFVPASMS
jgi:hypothetical protein